MDVVTGVVGVGDFNIVVVENIVGHSFDLLPTSSSFHIGQGSVEPVVEEWECMFLSVMDGKSE